MPTSTSTFLTLHTTRPSILQEASPVQEEVRNLCRLLEEETIEEIKNPEVRIQCIRQMLVRIDREAGDVEEAHVLQNFAKIQREHFDLIKKLLAWYWQCCSKGIYAQL